MTTKVIYRVEHPETKHGPFYSGISYEMPSKLHDRMYSMPTPHDWWKEDRDHKFGCESMAGLKELFNERLMHYLRHKGFVLAMYEVPTEHVQSCPNGIQCTFNHNNAQRLNEQQLIAA